jgi:steroid delta-isomerase-like uncharacterized protein
MAGLRADPGLVAAARRIHLLEAVRQDARNALLAAEAALAAALEAGHEDSAGIVRADCAALASRIAELDAAIERAWRAGLRQAEATRDRPPPEGWEDLVPGPAEVVLEHWRRMYVEGDLDAVDELVAEDYVNHEAAEDRAPGRRGARETVAWLREAFADLTMDVDDVIEQGDKVVVRATMRGRHVGAAGPLARFPVTGREFAVQHIHIFRVADGRIAEHWACRDDLGHLAQLGLLPGA